MITVSVTVTVHNRESGRDTGRRRSTLREMASFGVVRLDCPGTSTSTSRGSSTAPQQNAQQQQKPPSFRLRFVGRVVGNDHQQQVYKSTLAYDFYEAHGGRTGTWDSATLVDLRRFVERHVLRSWRPASIISSVSLAVELKHIAIGDGGDKTLQLTCENMWRKAQEDFFSIIVVNHDEVRAIYVDMPNAESDLSRALRDPDLSSLQQGAQRRHSGMARSIAAAKMLGDAVDETDGSAADAVPRVCSNGDLILCLRLRHEAEVILGAGKYAAHPALWFCPCSGEHLRSPALNDWSGLINHLSNVCRKRSGAAGNLAVAILNRIHQYRYEGEIATPLPVLPALDIKSKFIFHLAPNVLADGGNLHWSLYLLNSLMSSGKLRHSHILAQMIESFVTMFFGLDSPENFPWWRFPGYFFMMESINNMTRRVYQLLSVNGQVGSSPSSSSSSSSSS